MQHGRVRHFPRANSLVTNPVEFKCYLCDYVFVSDGYETSLIYFFILSVVIANL